MSTKQMLSAAALSAVLLAFSPWAPASAATTAPSCTTDPDSTSTVVGDDVCTVDANSGVILASSDIGGSAVADVDLLGNDGLANASCWDITNVSTDASVDDLYLDLFTDKTGDGQSFCSFSLSLSTSAAGSYSFSYTLTDGGTRTVTLNVKPYVPPIAPTVKKTKKPGYIKACNHERYAMDFYYGTFKQPRWDGNKFVAAHSCKVIRVHRHGIDWVALGHRNGVFMGSGHVSHIALPKGDGPSNLRSMVTSQRSTSGAHHWGLALS